MKKNIFAIAILLCSVFANASDINYPRAKDP